MVNFYSILVDVLGIVLGVVIGVFIAMSIDYSNKLTKLVTNYPGLFSILNELEQKGEDYKIEIKVVKKK